LEDRPLHKLYPNNGWILHLTVVIAMYSYYIYLWYGFIFYDGKAGWKGFEIFIMTCFTGPFYLIFHLMAFFISRRANAFKITRASLMCISLLIVHVIAVALTL